ncbi:MAG: hypothetical protein HZA47_07335 [Planctomycetes bacterium]|uniref:hypothetical protein n=1 Tax=Candidatus Wunengus sp. YC65 TaxID=3367701 RepID=UPI001D5496F9|nr:hypothetical protein [Planctomycetota bacterium]
MGVSRILLVFTIAIIMAMFLVWERNKIIESGYQVAKLQKNCTELSEKNRKLNYHVNRLKSPQIIVYKIQSLKMPLVPQDATSGIIMLGQAKFQENVAKSQKTSLNKDLYTQKDQILNCCSLHN